jgi:carboxypeptidase C (cathepsin A)
LNRISSRLAAVALMASLAGAPAFAAPTALLAPAASAAKSLSTPSGPLFYQVSWDEAPLAGPDGTAEAVMSTLSYVRRDHADPQGRPVLFIWGGGPGGQSVGLAFGGIGPRRLAQPDAKGARAIVDNGATVLDVADLVFIDAVGTGFTGELKPGGGKPFWSVEGDAAAFEQVIRQWLQAHGRTRSPVYLMGESYGGFRVGKVVDRLQGVHVAGAILVSPGINLSAVRGDLTAVSADPHWTGGIDDDQAYINNLPTMAVVAVAQHRVDGRGRSTSEIYEEARRFAQGAYAAALQQGDQLDAADRDRLALQMAAMTGVSAESIAQANLRLQSQAFLEALAPGRVVGRLDARVLGEPPKQAADSGRTRAAADPSLGMNGASVLTSPWTAEYLRNEVGVRTGRPYVRVNLDVNDAWNWNPSATSLEANIVGLDVGPDLGRYLRGAEDARLLLLSGYYDMATPMLAQEGELEHVGAPRGRIVMKRYEAGHELNNDPVAAPQVAVDIRAFIQAAPGAR